MRYDILMIDPPWPKKKGGIRKVRPNQNKELDYSTESTITIGSILSKTIIPLYANETNTVFLWTIDSFLFEAEIIMESLGYKRHARLIWDKGNGVAPCFSIRYSHEYLIWFYKPKFQPVSKESSGKYTTVFHGGLREHSRKPDFAYEMVNKMYPNASKIDVFSREKRNGWDQWGDQINHF